MAEDEAMLDEADAIELDELDALANDQSSAQTSQNSTEENKEIQKKQQPSSPRAAKKSTKKSAAQLEKILKEKSLECDEWKQKFERVRTLAKKIRDENQEMKEKYEDFEEACDTIEKLENALAASDMMSKTRKVEIEKLQDEITKFKDSPDGKVANLNQVAETRTLQAELLNCKTELLQYKKVMGPDHTKFLKKLETQILKLTSENKYLRQKNQRYTAASTLQNKQSESFEIASLTIDLSAAKTRFQTAEAELKVFNTELEKLKSDTSNIELTQTKIDLKANQAKCQALSNSFKKLQAELGKAKSEQPSKSEISRLTIELKSTQAKLSTAEDIIMKYQSKESRILDHSIRYQNKRKDIKILQSSLSKKRKLSTILD